MKEFRVSPPQDGGMTFGHYVVAETALDAAMILDRRMRLPGRKYDVEWPPHTGAIEHVELQEEVKA